MSGSLADRNKREFTNPQESNQGYNINDWLKAQYELENYKNEQKRIQRENDLKAMTDELPDVDINYSKVITDPNKFILDKYTIGANAYKGMTDFMSNTANAQLRGASVPSWAQGALAKRQSNINTGAYGQSVSNAINTNQANFNNALKTDQMSFNNEYLNQLNDINQKGQEWMNNAYLTAMEFG